METHRIFTFVDEKNKEEKTVVQIIESTDDNFGLFIWPCSINLSNYLWKERGKLFSETSIVYEIGCGTALPGLLLCKLGIKKMILSDLWNDENDLIFKNLKKEIELNKLTNVELLKLKWNLNSISLEDFNFIKNNPPNLIIGSDCFYDKSKSINHTILT
eukprot:gene3471-6120_t